MSTDDTSDKPEAFRNLENFTRAILSVPKSEIDAVAKQEEEEKRKKKKPKK